MKSVAIHSHKGGTGKTTLSINLAVLLAKQGYNVCLLDADFSAPNLQTFFRSNPKKYLNDFINNTATSEECIYQIELTPKLEGKLFIGYADPTSKGLDQMINIDNKTAGKMLKRLYQLKMEFRKAPYEIDFLILDTTPGIGLTTINSFVITDNIMFVIKLSNADIDGTVHMIGGLLDSLPTRAMMIANQIPADKIDSESKQSRLTKLLDNYLAEKSESTKIEFLGWIATDSELQSIEFDIGVSTLAGVEMDRTIFTLHKPDHPFSKTLEKIGKQIFMQED